jgi:hypothetical protein
MADIAEAEIAVARGAALQASEPRAVPAHYDRAARRVVIELTNGSALAFPARLAQGLEGATEEQLAQVAVRGSGYGLRWEALDVDLSIPGLTAGIFGTKAHMARLDGRATSPAKAISSRANGAKGGRPRKAKSA